MLSRNLITNRKNYVSKKCLYWYGEQSQLELDTTLNNTISGETNKEQLIIDSIHGTITHVKTMNWKSLSNMMKESLTQLVIELQGFLQKSAATDINLQNNDKKIKALAQSIEQVLYTRNINIVTPFTFKRDLVLYSVTNSKELATMNRKWEGCGS